MNKYIKSIVLIFSLAIVSFLGYKFFILGSNPASPATTAEPSPSTLSTPNNSSASATEPKSEPKTKTKTEKNKEPETKNNTEVKSEAEGANIIFNRDYRATPIGAKNDESINNFYVTQKLCQNPTVIEFFSYGCPGCYMAEKKFQDWKKNKAENIQFKRVPVNFHSGWDILAKMYFTNEELNITEDLHSKIFDWVQTRVNPMVPVSTSEVEKFIKEVINNNPELAKKVTVDNYMNILNSSALGLKINRSMEMFAKYGLDSSPSVVINNQYVVTVGLAQNLDNFMVIIQNLAKGKTSCNA